MYYHQSYELEEVVLVMFKGLLLSINFKIWCLRKKSSNACRVRGGVSPTVRDRGKCSWPSVHSLAPPSPTACTETVAGGLYTYWKHSKRCMYECIHIIYHKLLHTCHCETNYAESTLHAHTHWLQGYIQYKCTHSPTLRQHTPDSWRSSARYPQPPRLAAGGLTEPQLSFLLSLKGEKIRNVKYITYISSLHTLTPVENFV